MIPKVVLFSYDSDLERVCAAAMRSCYSPYSAYKLFAPTKDDLPLEGEKLFDKERVDYLLKKAIELGHHDVLEHGSLTYDIQCISRACSHQLVRHRLASFSQQSQRYVRIARDIGHIKPPSIPDELRIPVSINGQNLNLNFGDIIDITRQIEEGYVKAGIKPEDARYARINAAATNIVTTMNPRQLLHVFSLRCSPDAQWEIRCLAWAMYACARLIAPLIFENIPNSDNRDYFAKKISKLNEILLNVRPKFETIEAGELFEIPLEGLGLEHSITAFVRKNR